MIRVTERTLDEAYRGGYMYWWWYYPFSIAEGAVE